MVSQVRLREERLSKQSSSYSQVLEPGGGAPRGHVGGHQGGREAEDRVGGAWAMTFTGVSEEKTGRAGQTGQDWLVCIFWGSGSSSVCRQRNCFLGSGAGPGGGSVSLHIKGIPNLGPMSPALVSLCPIERCLSACLLRCQTS